MKVYIATSGEYSDYRIEHVFARREDAEAYEGGEQVGEWEVCEGPVEMRPWRTLIWNPDLENPHEYSMQKDFDGHPEYAVHRWNMPPATTRPVLIVEGWDLHRIRKVYSEQRAQYIARQDVRLG